MLLNLLWAKSTSRTELSSSLNTYPLLFTHYIAIRWNHAPCMVGRAIKSSAQFFYSSLYIAVRQIYYCYHKVHRQQCSYCFILKVSFWAGRNASYKSRYCHFLGRWRYQRAWSPIPTLSSYFNSIIAQWYIFYLLTILPSFCFLQV